MSNPGYDTKIDYRSLLESAPDLYLILSPSFDIMSASNAYLNATLTEREIVTGRPLFEVFPDNPNDLQADGVSNLRQSLNIVLDTKLPHKMSVQKYDIRNANGTFEVRYWSPLNTPVLNEQNEVAYIIHRVEDVTELEEVKNEHKYLEVVTQKHLDSLEQSEERFRKIFNASPIAMLITDASDGMLKYVNKSFEGLFKLSREEAIGKTLIDLRLIDKDNRMQLTQHVIDEGGHGVEMELEVYTSDNELRQVIVSTEMIEIAGQTCFLKAMIDITERKHTEEMLKKTNHFLDTVLDNMPSMVLVRDATDLRVIRMNKAAEEILGMTRDYLIGKNAYELYPTEQAELLINRDREIFENGGLQDLEEPLNIQNTIKWIHSRRIPVYENNQPLYLLGISQDITEKKKQQDAILELNKELEAFSYSVAHDLRAPLRAITGFSKMLESDLGNDIGADVLRQLNKISKNAENMGCLIDDLLAFSKLGKKQVKLEKINMNQLVDWALAEISKYRSYDTEIKVAQLPSIRADFKLMCQVMINLLGNAIKYSSKKEKPVVYVDAYTEGENIVYRIKDNGAGFDMKYSDKLFGVFQRLHRQDEFEGSGVGLAIVNRIVSKHNGKVWAEGKLNEGAIFYFSLPVN